MQPIGVTPTKTHTTTKQNTEYNTVIAYIHKISTTKMYKGKHKLYKT